MEPESESRTLVMQPRKIELAILTAQKEKDEDKSKPFFQVSFWRNAEDKDSEQVGPILRIDDKKDFNKILDMFGLRQHRSIVVPNTDVTIYYLV